MLNNTNITNIKSALKDKVIIKTVSRKLAKPKTTLLIQLELQIDELAYCMFASTILHIFYVDTGTKHFLRVNFN